MHRDLYGNYIKPASLKIGSDHLGEISKAIFGNFFQAILDKLSQVILKLSQVILDNLSKSLLDNHLGGFETIIQELK